MKEVFSGRCLWDFSVKGEIIILDKGMTLPVDSCTNRIIVTHTPSPDIFLYMHNALAIVTETGGVLCHAAVLALEMGCPIIVGAKDALSCVEEGKTICLIAKNGIGVAYETAI